MDQEAPRAATAETVARVTESFERQGTARYVHAGATSAIADSAGGYAALTLMPKTSEVLTVEYKLNLLAPADGEWLEATGTVLKSGRTLSVCRLEVHTVTDGDRTLVAAGQQTLITVPGAVSA